MIRSTRERSASHAEAATPPLGMDGAVAIAILLLSGCNMALPSLGWATPIQVAHGVFVPDVLLMGYLFLVFVSGTAGGFFVDRRARGFAGMVALLGLLGIISAGMNAYRFLDIGQAIHLLLFAGLLLLAYSWGVRWGSTFALRWFLTGLLCGGAINLFFTFAKPKLLIGILPILYMQNGGGGVLGLGVVLGAWLMLIRRNRHDKVAALVALPLGVAASALSWSKTAMSICAFGLLAWTVLFMRSVGGRRLWLVGPAVVALVAGGVAYVVRSSDSSDVNTTDITGAIVRAVTIKFSGIDVNDKYSVGTRYMYFFGVADILSRHPLFGVSYGGFYDAMTHTPAYDSGLALEEDPELGAEGSSNPHNSFLYYTSANGAPGLILAVGMYLTFLLYLWRTLGPQGAVGRIVWGCVAFGYFIYGNTLPTLYDTAVLYVPAAVVLAQLSRRRAERDAGVAGIPEHLHARSLRCAE